MVVASEVGVMDFEQETSKKKVAYSPVRFCW